MSVIDTNPDIELSVSAETVCFIIVKAREFDVKDEVTEPDPGSNPTDDGDIAVLEDHGDDPSAEEIRAMVGALSEDEQVDTSLPWLGAAVRRREWAMTCEAPPSHQQDRPASSASRCSAITSRGSGWSERAARVRDRPPVARLLGGLGAAVMASSPGRPMLQRKPWRASPPPIDVPGSMRTRPASPPRGARSRERERPTRQDHHASAPAAHS
jgi:hypothetical protein